MGVEVQRRIMIEPPVDLKSYSPSALFRYFITIGDWTYASFADDLSQFLKDRVVPTETVASWGGRDVVPRVYRMPFLTLLMTHVEPEIQRSWHKAFLKVWAEQRARRSHL